MPDAYRAMSAAGKSRFLIDQLSLDWEKRVLTLVSNTASVGSLFVTNSAWLTTGGRANRETAPYTRRTHGDRCQRSGMTLLQ